MAIDTDDLSDKTYNAIILESEKFNDNLTLQFGLLSYECNNEEEYIDRCKKLIQEMLQYDEGTIDDIFFGEPPVKEKFHWVLNKIFINISTLNR